MGFHIDNDGKMTEFGNGDSPNAKLRSLALDVDRAFTAIADAAVELAGAEDDTATTFLLKELRARVAEWRAACEAFVQAQRAG